MMFKKTAWACLVAMALSNQTYAVEGEFITIIGPDGRPMVVPFLDKKTPTNSTPQKQQRAVLENNKQVENISFKQAEKTLTAPQTIPSVQISPQLNTPPIEQTQVEIAKQPQINNIVGESAVSKVDVQNSQVVTPVAAEKKASTEQIPSPSNLAKVNNEDQEQAVKQNTNVDNATEDLPYKLIDGEKYYESEYLESKEFNLEQKKRFYQIPGLAGGSNWDIIEREKGVDMSFFNSTQKQERKSQEIIALGSAYKILNKNELLQVLPLQCVDQKVQKKAKSLVVDKTLSLWPRAPFDDRFDYQLVKLDQSIENMKILSYADRLDNPTYYWPMMVFLDEQGCVIEGASAFSTEMNAATMLQNASIEGVIHVPKYSKFIMLVPLEQAVDVPELKLSNQGQIDLKVLR